MRQQHFLTVMNWNPCISGLTLLTDLKFSRASFSVESDAVAEMVSANQSHFKDAHHTRSVFMVFPVIAFDL